MKRVVVVGTLLPRDCGEFGTHREARVMVVKGDRRVAVRHILQHEVTTFYPKKSSFAWLFEALVAMGAK